MIQSIDGCYTVGISVTTSFLSLLIPEFCFLSWKSSQEETTLYAALLVAADIVSVLNFTSLKYPERNLENSKNNLGGNNGRQNKLMAKEHKSKACVALSRSDCRGKVVRKKKNMLAICNDRRFFNFRKFTLVYKCTVLINRKKVKRKFGCKKYCSVNTFGCEAV